MSHQEDNCAECSTQNEELQGNEVMESGGASVLPGIPDDTEQRKPAELPAVESVAVMPSIGASPQGSGSSRLGVIPVPRPTIVIVGGGFSGTLLAVNLLRSCQPLRVVLVERRLEVGLGVAYSTSFEGHLLNVPASNMSAFPGQPDHFLRWLKGRLPDAHAHTFAPRKLYGAYLQEVLTESLDAAHQGYQHASFERLHDEVVSVVEHVGGRGATVTLASSQQLQAHFVVLATGHQPPALPSCPGLDTLSGGRLVSNPWSGTWLQHLRPTDPILLLGTGLTMVDMVLSLRAAGHRGTLFAVSRHGYRPLPQRPDLYGQSFQFAAQLEGMSLRALVQTVRAAIHEEGQRDSGRWRLVIDALRSQTARIWQEWRVEDQRRFLRHFRASWDAVRHRIAPEIDQQLQTLIEGQHLRIFAGRLKGARATHSGVEVLFQPRHARHLSWLHAAAVVNCTGRDTDLRRSSHPLVKGLLQQGRLVPDALGLGALTADDGALIGRNGDPSCTLFAIGPLLRPRLWESIAVPELRNQAVVLASRIVGSLRYNLNGAFAVNQASRGRLILDDRVESW